MADQTIGEIALGESTKLIFSVSEWHGRQFAGVRKFVATQRYEGWTKAGLSINKKLLREITAALAKLEKTIPPREEHEFGRLPKNETDYIKIGTLPSEEEAGLPAVDVREFVDSPSYQGPTKRGIRFRWNLLPDVIACLREQAKVMGDTERNEPSLFGTGAFAEPEPVALADGPCADGLVEVLGEVLKSFPGDFVDGTAGKGTLINLPEETLRLEQENTGGWILKTDDSIFAKIRNPAEGNFILYAQMRGLAEVVVPAAMIEVFKVVKGYENYVRTVQTKVVATLTKKARQRSVAEYEARKKCQESGIPWLLGEKG